MGILIIIQTITLIIIIGKLHYSFWFSYIIFLVFIGGLFILFIYIISLIYNNKFYFIKKLNYFIFRLLILIIIKFNLTYIFNYETNLINNRFLIKENYLNSLKFYNLPNNYINLILILYLLLLIIIVVKITNFLSGPIRTIN